MFTSLTRFKPLTLTWIHAKRQKSNLGTSLVVTLRSGINHGMTNEIEQTCIILLFLPCKSGKYLKQFRCTNHLGSFACLKQTMCQRFKINRLQLSLIKTKVEELIYLSHGWNNVDSKLLLLTTDDVVLWVFTGKQLPLKFGCSFHVFSSLLWR